MEEVVRENEAQSGFLARSQVTRFFPIKETIDYDWKRFRIPRRKELSLNYVDYKDFPEPQTI